MSEWKFYGRQTEIADIEAILKRSRFFFCQISGRRRIGKTSLIQEALKRQGRHDQTFYIQIPDGDAHGVVQVFNEALEDMSVEGVTAAASLNGVAERLFQMWQKSIVTAVDEFQYFHRKALDEFTSHLQARIDKMQTTPASGGLFALGSIHTEMTALLEDKASPLFSRVTDRVAVSHWDWATLFEMFGAHAITNRHHQLFLWNLFEGVPKFYRDCFDQGALIPGDDHRESTLGKLFFSGSSPLKDEADNWFLRELRGRYDSVLALLAKNGPIGHNYMMAEYADQGGDAKKQLGGYLKTLIEKYAIVERKLPIFAKEKERKARYQITDNFLASWLGSLKRHVQAARVRPLAEVIAKADRSLMQQEGVAFEKLVKQCLEELSRKGLGDFAASEFINGYWDKADDGSVEIDIVAYCESEEKIRFGSCKRSANQHTTDSLRKFKDHVDKFQNQRARRLPRVLKIEYALYAPEFSLDQRSHLHESGYLCYDMNDFEKWLYPDFITAVNK